MAPGERTSVHATLEHIVKTLKASILTLAITTLMAGTAAAACTYTVRGTVQVDHALDTINTQWGTSALANIQVKLYAKKKVWGIWATWGSWGTTTTDANGQFSITKSKSCDARRFKVKVKFDSDELEIRHETSTSSATKVTWYTILKETSGNHGSAAGTKDLGTFSFESGGDEALGDAEPRDHADIWVLYQAAIAELASFGSDFEFTRQVKIKYPHDGIVGDSIEASYANPFTQVIYIISNTETDALTTNTLLHELMHIWAYQHSTGESGLVLELLMDGSTHDAQEEPFVAFHEGFASYGNDMLQECLFGDDEPKPFARPALADDFADLDEVTRRDDGVESALHLLTLENVHRYNFDTTSSDTVTQKTLTMVGTCEDPTMTFKDVLSVFNADSGAGHSSSLDDSEMDIESFFERAADIVDGFDHADLYLDLTDPTGTENPWSELCQPMVFFP
ncbi:MAG: hypothetical protein ACI9WU_003256 [Myxococcota bacterium]